MAVVFTMTQAEIEKSKQIQTILQGVTDTGKSMLEAAKLESGKQIVVENRGITADIKTSEAQTPVASK